MDKRKHERIRLLDRAEALCQGHPCLFNDISRGGVSIVYDSRNELPDVMSVALRLPETGLSMEDVKCTTVWETSMPFVSIHGRTVLKKRGMSFTDPQNPSLDAVLRHLADQSGRES